jgi:hypothetical protein
MDLLKVFVGDAAVSGAITKNTMVKGDLLLLDAATHAVADANSTAVVIAACNDKGVYVSTPITAAGIKYIKYQAYTPPVEATSTAVIPTALTLATSTTYSIGVQIKEDLRMGTYNKNTEIIGVYTTPAVIPSDGFVKMEMASTIAKGFAANPLTSAGSPSQLVSVFRPSPGTAFTGVTTTTENLVVTTGSRLVTYTGTLNTGIATGLASGPVVLNLGTSWYLVEKVDIINKIITLDTAFQGTSGTVTAGVGAAQAYFTTTLPTVFSFEFDAVVQTQKNRYDQFRMVDFVVITPKGNDSGVIKITPTAPTYPTGSFRQIRDLEEKAYTNSSPLINYREFPFEDFALNATSGTNYATFTIAYSSGWGYNMMQSSQPEFLQTVVVAAPAAVNSQFDSTLGTANASNFATTWNVWNTAVSAGYAFANLS